MRWLTKLLRGRTILRLAADAIDLVHRARRVPEVAARIAADPDRAFRSYARAAAFAAGVKLSEEMLDLIAVEILARELTHGKLGPNAREILADLERWEREGILADLARREK